MAWVTEYDMTWLGQNANGSIYIKRDGGSYQFPLTLKRDSLQLRIELSTWDSAVIRQNCGLSIVNDLSDYYDLLPLMTISDGQYFVVVEMDDPYSHVIFEGYLNCEIVSQPMLQFNELRLTASSLLSKLEHLEPDSIEVLTEMSLIDIIDDCLALIGTDYNYIYVNCSLFESDSPLSSGQTLFNRTGVYTELFWENNKDRMSALEIIEAILKPFDCYLYWYDQNFYIEHYQDLGEATKTWVYYTPQTSAGYGSEDIAAWTSLPANSYDVHGGTNHTLINAPSIVSVTPGMREIKIRANQKQYFNLFNPDLSDVTYNDDLGPGTDVGIRQWMAYEKGDSSTSYPDWFDAGQTYRNISNSIQRYNWKYPNAHCKGLYTRFRVTTIVDETWLNIKFKFATGFSDIPGTFKGNESDYVFEFYWYLEIAGTSNYVYYDDVGEEWTTGVDQDPNEWLQIMEVPGTDMNTDLGVTYEGEISIFLGEAFGSTQDREFVFCMGSERVTGVGNDVPCINAWYGDFHASVSGSPDDNEISGTINTDFLDEKTISLDLFDTNNWTYRNTLMRSGDSLGLFDTRTTSWGHTLDSSLSDVDTLMRKLLQNKFRLYNVARQELTVRYKMAYPGGVIYYPRILTLFTDSKQGSKKFIMHRLISHLESDQHEMVLREYDNTETINLI